VPKEINVANSEQVLILKRGPLAWSEWRQRVGGSIKPDLSRITFTGADLNHANLSEANLSNADLSRTNLTGANLMQANLSEADLSEADLSRATLFDARLSRAVLAGTDFGEANLFKTIFSDVDLSTCKNLDSIIHRGPSTVDIRALERSYPLPLGFMRGVGLPDALIEYLPLLLNSGRLYSCFISYSAKDDDFVRRLYADLQANGVRCWFAPEDMKIGAKILDTLDEAIRRQDKLLLVLSEASIGSEWVEDEVTKAFEEERRRKTTVVFPLYVDGVVFKTDEAWASKLRNRHIGDFRQWKDDDAYKRSFDRLLRDLRVKTSDPT
jgi:hypothetical protein